MRTGCKHEDIKLCWIPNHIEVEGITTRDLAAKSDLKMDVDSTTKILIE